MKILVFNAGSSSLKFGVFDMDIADSRIVKGEFERFRDGQCTLHFRLGGEQGSEQQRSERLATIEDAVRHVPKLLDEWDYAHIDAIGHRVVHGGEYFTAAAMLDDETLARIESCTPLAPLHNPANLAGIRHSRAVWPDKPQVAVFDTAFHQSMSAAAYSYAVPKVWRQRGLRRYGFHGTSHHYVALRAAQELQRPVTELRIASCHLGNGASVCAIARGVSVDTSMGMTPLEGLVMGTRSGDVDPGLFSFLSRNLGLSVDEIEKQLYENSGLKALAGSQDLRDIDAQAEQGDRDAQLAIEIYAYRVRKYLGAYAAAMGGLDVIVFTGGIGENSASMRHRICDRLQFLGLYLDLDKNRAVRLQGFEALQVARDDSPIKIIVTQTNEQLMIAKEAQRLLAETAAPPVADWSFPLTVLRSHVQLSREAVDALFGEGYQLGVKQRLTQPAQWTADETASVVGPSGVLHDIPILGPERDATQITVSRTDTFTLGIEAPARTVGEVENTPSVRLRGPHGEYVAAGVVAPGRYILLNAEEADALGLHDGDLVDVRVNEGEHGLLANTEIRVRDGGMTEMYIGSDDARQAGVDAASHVQSGADRTGKKVRIMARRARAINDSEDV